MGNGDAAIDDWIMRSFRKSFVSGPMMLMANMVLTWIPGFNWLSSFYLGWWAILDYYDEQYVLMQGPYYVETDVGFAFA